MYGIINQNEGCVRAIPHVKSVSAQLQITGLQLQTTGLPMTPRGIH